MYNLNVNMGAAAHHNLLSLGLDAGCTTPKTPEILNSLIAMSNPFDGYAQHRTAGQRGPRQAACPPGTSDSSSSGSPMGSPESPPSVQHTCSQLIKEGLKLTIQTKRRHNGQDATDAADDRRPLKMARMGGEVSPHLLDDDDDEYDDLFSPGAGLTAEDEERRRRRRERNKVAATKCRLKKRERTVNLVQESEILENQNLDLKGQIQELETQRRRLMDMLSMHRPSCQKGAPPPPQQPPPPPPQQQQQQNGFQYPEYAAPAAPYGAPPPHEPPAPQYTHYTDACNYSGGGYAASDNGCMV